MTLHKVSKHEKCNLLGVHLHTQNLEYGLNARRPGKFLSKTYN